MYLVGNYNLTVFNVTVISSNYGIYSRNNNVGSAIDFLTINSSSLINNVYGYYSWGDRNLILTNSNLSENSNTGIYIRYNYAYDNIFRNLIVNDNGIYGIFLYGSNSDKYFENLTVLRNQAGLYFDMNVVNNTFINSNISLNSIYEIFFDYSFSNVPVNNTFQDSYLGNWSRIDSNGWSSTTPNYFYDNTYLDGTYSGICFDDPINLSCEGLAPILGGGNNNDSNLTIASYPSVGIFSKILLVLFISLFFIFN